MYRGKSKLLPIALLAIVTVVAIIAMVSIGRAILNGGDQDQVVDDSAARALLTTEADRSVRMTVRGPIVADENFRSYEIEVSPIGRRMTTYTGYQGEIIDANRLDNSSKAYTELVHALSQADFTKQTKDSNEIENIEGVCANGRLYTFELLQAQSVVSESWTSSCRDIIGSFQGNAILARDLLHDQIPNRRELLKAIDIY